MGLSLQRLCLHNWRNFTNKILSFPTGTTVLVGLNAVGKTNTIEALQLLTSGFSFRHPRPSQLILDGCDSAYAKAKIVGDGRQIDIECKVGPNKKIFLRNGKRCYSQEIPQTLMSVLFNPDDLSFVKRSAATRRDELDFFGRQISASYGKVVSTYMRSIEQRNNLLKDPFIDPNILHAWDISVSAGAAALLYARLKLFSRLRIKAEHIYQEISDGEMLTCTYSSSLKEKGFNLSKAEMEQAFLNLLTASHDEDHRRQQTTVGPHHDDLCFFINDKNARIYGSQGQQRTIVLAWKMAEVSVAEDIVGEKPLLLLDDVMSELDSHRRDAVIKFVEKDIQTIITTTNLDYFSHELLDRAEVVTFNGCT